MTSNFFDIIITAVIAGFSGFILWLIDFPNEFIIPVSVGIGLGYFFWKNKELLYVPS